jgi:hypothetical protein
MGKGRTLKATHVNECGPMKVISYRMTGTTRVSTHASKLSQLRNALRFTEWPRSLSTPRSPIPSTPPEATFDRPRDTRSSSICYQSKRPKSLPLLSAPSLPAAPPREAATIARSTSRSAQGRIRQRIRGPSCMSFSARARLRSITYVQETQREATAALHRMRAHAPVCT